LTGRKLLICCEGGFGNRFNSLISGLALAIKLNYKPIVYWPKKNACRASFDSLFTDFVEFTEIKPELENCCNIFHMPYLGIANFHSLNTISSFSKIKELAKEQDVSFLCCSIPGFIINELGKDLEITKEMIQFKHSIVEKAQEIISKNTSEKYYGMHLRKTDFQSRLSSDNLEISFKRLVNANPDKKYFICSDDEVTEKQLCEYDNVFRFDKTSYVEKYKDQSPWRGNLKHEDGYDISFNIERDQQSVVEAIIDLIILSRSNMLCRNTGSTFLDVAHLMKGCF